MVECRTPEREVRGSRPTAAVLCPWARHFTPRKYWLITQEAMAPSRHDWKIVDWDVKPQHNQPTNISIKSRKLNILFLIIPTLSSKPYFLTLLHISGAGWKKIVPRFLLMDFYRSVKRFLQPVKLHEISMMKSWNYIKVTVKALN